MFIESSEQPGSPLLVDSPVQEIDLVASYHVSSLQGDPYLYPGDRPAGSYVTDGRVVRPVEVHTDNGITASVVVNGELTGIDEHLVRQQVPPLGERLPVLAYGANMSPASLATKFGKAGAGRPDLLVVPTLYADLPGHDVVWSAGPGMKGHFVAQLYKDDSLAETEVQVGLNFLTREQLLMMHATELSWQLSSVTALLGGQAVEAYVYVGQDSVHLRDGRPVAISSVKAKNRRLEQATARQMSNSVLAIDEIQKMLHEVYPQIGDEVLDADGYIELVCGLKPNDEERRPRRALKTMMAKYLRELGMVEAAGAKPDDSGYYSWANPSTLRTFAELQKPDQHHNKDLVYVLPEMELPIDKWPASDENGNSARRKILSAVGRHHELMLDAARTN